ncbi:GAP family protein [Streptomyces sp. HNM0645]|uniref:GAP family protein n=1 Tax=Streptomyces sp. HNM0645 TaxID=2782343 RepID=UPI0024B857FD|nr:GAP family protein [Streptomyces sp. HNM0645]MDI9883059.1 GAP family protein [Streptomyces sp. HNM0645]
MIAETVAPALGIALSPFPLVPAILLLLTARARQNSSAFIVGWMAGVAGAAALSTLPTSVVEIAGEPPAWVSWGRIGLGGLLVLLGAGLWTRRRRRGAKADPTWIRALETVTWPRALRLGLLLSAANPKILALIAAGGVAIGSARPTAAGRAGSIALFTLIASAGVALPPLLRLLAGERILPPLGRAMDWLKVHGTTVVAVVIGLMGIMLVAKGAGGL